MLYIIDKGFNTLKTFNFAIDGNDYVKKAVEWCTENGYELISEKQNSLGDLFWTVNKI